ncbi:hypothetical protein BDV96DRAFT_497107 [Lophiotrema nucula]|uniref:FAD-binding domain-containing protein n=1 Tax=Lophiotrema nucula TaxID=690887 RepID=A0A6A5Z243_9PLEO|nr:hypothetical protein BDV96DRAFT_497107 [Lophiotrema nucula]
MRVLISGAGIAGPALAWWLAKTGARITVVEKAAALFPHGQNVDIQGTARKVVKKMGLLEEVLRYNTTEKGTQLIDAKGRPFAPFPVREDANGASATSEFEVLRGDLAAIFYKATKDEPNVDYLFSTTIEKIVSNDDESVKVQLSSGETQKYDVLVAADGQWSKVRKQVFPKDAITVVDKNMYVCYWTIPRLPMDNSWWNIYCALRSRIITLRPDPHGTIRAMFSMMPCNAAEKAAWEDASRKDRKLQQELCRSHFADAGWQAQRLLSSMDQASDFYFQAIKQIKMSKWSKGRIICLGDTAFAPSPLTGMGTSLAILGSYVLAGELSKLNAGDHPAKAFDSYETIFRPFVEEMQQVPWIFPDLVHPQTAIKRWMLSSFLSLLSKIVAIPWLASRFNGADNEDFKLPVYAQFEGEKST